MRRHIFSILLLLLISSIAFSQAKKRITILAIGDSVTEGSEGKFESYLFPLWEKLYTAGYQFEFVGPRKLPCRIGELNHFAQGGKNSEYLESNIDSIYQLFPADVVLIHSGHNHFADEDPVHEAHKSMINKILRINPDATILDAAVITSGKLPKYSYIPALNKAIKKMVKSYHSNNIICVDQAKGFDWRTMTIEDKVHPNKQGAEEIARTWFNSIRKRIPSQKSAFTPEIVTYKQDSDYSLSLHIFKPKNLKKIEKRPVVVYFFGGGWRVGTPLQFYEECSYYASKGIVAIAADYRIAFLNHSTPVDSFDDAKDAIRWIRNHAKELCIDPDKIASAGASAGGQLAAALGTIQENTESALTSYRPNLMLLYYPVIDNGPDGYGPEILKTNYQKFSPMHNVSSSTPPALFILGTKDSLIPVATAQQFQQKMIDAGVDVELHLIEGAGHPIYQYRKGLSPNYYLMQEFTDGFLRKYGYLK